MQVHPGQHRGLRQAGEQAGADKGKGKAPLPVRQARPEPLPPAEAE